MQYFIVNTKLLCYNFVNNLKRILIENRPKNGNTLIFIEYILFKRL